MKSKRQLEIEVHTNITFHRFPKAEDRRLRWANALGLDLTSLPKNAYICSLHFTEESFDRTSLSCVRLRNYAIPCVDISHNKADDSEPDDFLLSHVKQEPEPSKIANVQSTTVKDEVFAEEMVASCDATLQLLPNNITRKRYLKCEEECETIIPKRRCVTEIFDESTGQPKPLTSDVSTQTSAYPDAAIIPEPTDGRGTAVPPNLSLETPRETLLRKSMQNQKETSRKVIQALKKQNRRQVKKIAELQSTLNNLKAKNLIADEQYDILKTIGILHAPCDKGEDIYHARPFAWKETKD